PFVVRQIMDRLGRTPEEAGDLLPIVAAALRSTRGPEVRAGLAGVAGFVAGDPQHRPAIEQGFPEVKFGGTNHGARRDPRPRGCGVPPRRRLLAIASPEPLVFSPTPAAVGGAEPTCVPAPTAAGVGGVNASGPRSKSVAAGTLKHGGTGRLRVWAV